MSEFSLRLANQTDVPEIMEIMSAAHSAMVDPSDYITDPEDYVRVHVSEKGFIVLGMDGEEIAGFFMAVLPAYVRENTGYELDFSEEILCRTAILDSVAVRPAAQGQGLMGMLLQEALRRLAGEADFFVATVSPNNAASLHNFEKCGFHPLKEIRKPGGQIRYLMGLGFTALPIL